MQPIFFSQAINLKPEGLRFCAKIRKINQETIEQTQTTNKQKLTKHKNILEQNHAVIFRENIYL